MFNQLRFNILKTPSLILGSRCFDFEYILTKLRYIEKYIDIHVCNIDGLPDPRQLGVVISNSITTTITSEEIPDLDDLF